MFTDNMAANGENFKGTSPSCYLFELIMYLRVWQMQDSFILHVIHITGTHVIRSGVDGLPLGDANEGVMSGISSLDFVPLHLDPIKWFPGELEWIRDWHSGSDLTLLDPEGWYMMAHGYGSYLWSLALEAVDAAVDKLRKARHKCPQALHIVIVPHLMTAQWCKQL